MVPEDKAIEIIKGYYLTINRIKWRQLPFTITDLSFLCLSFKFAKIACKVLNLYILFYLRNRAFKKEIWIADYDVILIQRKENMLQEYRE